MSQKDVAKILQCSVDTVQRNLREYGIPSRQPLQWMQHEPLILNQEQIEVLRGALLGDGSLIIHKNSRNPYFTYTSKSYQHVEYVCTRLFGKNATERIRSLDCYDKRTNKVYHRYVFKSLTNPVFVNEYYRWYPDGIKHVPSDIVLTPLTCLIWYIGDGSLISGKYTQDIKLSTHCFPKSEQETLLLPKLSNFLATIHIAGKSKAGELQYAIYIPHRAIEDFLDYIGDCPFQDYQYKWNFKKYHYSKFYKTHKDKENIFCEMYLSGATYYSIAKQFDIEPNAVKYYLKKHNLYPKKGVK